MTDLFQQTRALVALGCGEREYLGPDVLAGIVSVLEEAK